MLCRLIPEGIFWKRCTPSELAQNLRASIVANEMRLLEYRQNALFLPMRRSVQHKDRRPNPYAVEGEEDPYFRLVVRFAIEFEKTYIRWLYEALDEIEGRQRQQPVHGDAASPN